MYLYLFYCNYKHCRLSFIIMLQSRFDSIFMIFLWYFYLMYSRPNYKQCRRFFTCYIPFTCKVGFMVFSSYFIVLFSNVRLLKAVRWSFTCGGRSHVTCYIPFTCKVGFMVFSSYFIAPVVVHMWGRFLSRVKFIVRLVGRSDMRNTYRMCHSAGHITNWIGGMNSNRKSNIWLT